MTIIKNPITIISGEPTPEEKYTVTVIDYDGTVLDETELSTGQTYTLPTPPSNHSRLTFQEWSSNAEITNNTVTVTDTDILIGPIYTTTSGLSEFDIELNKNTGLDVTFNMVGNKNWGDGTSDASTTHTYADYGSYTITCDGTTIPQNCFGQSSSSINYYVVAIYLSNSVTRLEQYCLQYLYGLTEISVSNSINYISFNAFQYDILLTTVILPNNFPSSSGCFSSCYNLQRIVVPYSMTTIQSFYFQNCFNLNCPLPARELSVSSNSFNYCLALSSTIKLVPNPNLYTTFSNCYKLKIVFNPNSSYTRTGIQTFSSCYMLNSIKFPSSLTYINGTCFNGCTHLRDVDFSECTNLTEIEDSAFYGCRSLTNLDLSNCTSLTTIGASAFNTCNSLTNITLPDNLTTILSSCFKYSSINNIIIPESVTSIDGYAFSYCYNLLTIEIPSNVTNLSSGMFYNDYSLQSVVMKGQITDVGSGAFNNCYSCIIYDFRACTSVPTLANVNAFNGINGQAKIYVPDALYDEWIAATNWTNYANYIYKASEYPT